MKIRTIVGMLILISLVLGSAGVAAAGDCTGENCKDLCEDGVCDNCQDHEYNHDYDTPGPHGDKTIG
jgi:hypothetical protein